MTKRKNTKLSKTTTIVILLFAVICWLVEQMGLFEKKPLSETRIEQSLSVTPESEMPAKGLPLISHLEIPTLDEQRQEQVIEHIGYTVSFNPEWNIPNWVAYELSAEEVDGVEERNNHFVPDPMVKGDPVVTKDYSNSGYDRGHMAPAADMKWSAQAMRESFYMTNMCPQNHNLNAGDWKVLEEQVRSWAGKYDHVWICCGPIVSDASHTIGEVRKIVVPQSFFKVVLRQKDDSWAGIAFMMANRPRDGKWTLGHYAMSIEDMEIITGINFFPLLPDNVEEHVESAYALSEWGIQ